MNRGADWVSWRPVSENQDMGNPLRWLEGVEDVVEGGGGGFVEADELDELHAGGVGVLAAFHDGDLGGESAGEVVDAGGDRGESHGLDGVLASEVEAGAVAAGEECGFTLAAAVPYGADSVEDPLCREQKTGGGFGLSGGAATEFSARFQESGAGCPVDCAVYTASSKQGSVGSIDDSVGLALCNITPDDCEFRHAYSPLRITSSARIYDYSFPGRLQFARENFPTLFALVAQTRLTFHRPPMVSYRSCSEDAGRPFDAELLRTEQELNALLDSRQALLEDPIWQRSPRQLRSPRRALSANFGIKNLPRGCCSSLARLPWSALCMC